MGYKFPFDLVPSEARKHLQSMIKGSSTSASPPAPATPQLAAVVSSLRQSLSIIAVTEVTAQAFVPSATKNKKSGTVMSMAIYPETLGAAGSHQHEGCPVLWQERRQRGTAMADGSSGDATAKAFSQALYASLREEHSGLARCFPQAEFNPQAPTGSYRAPCPALHFQPCLLLSDSPFIPLLSVFKHIISRLISTGVLPPPPSITWNMTGALPSLLPLPSCPSLSERCFIQGLFGFIPFT